MPPVFAVPNKTTHIQMIPFSDDSILKSAFEKFRFGTNDNIYEHITETQILKYMQQTWHKIHIKLRV